MVGEVLVVPLPDACAQPGTVVVHLLYTPLALGTVCREGRPEHVATLAEFDLLQDVSTN